MHEKLSLRTGYVSEAEGGSIRAHALPTETEPFKATRGRNPQGCRGNHPEVLVRRAGKHDREECRWIDRVGHNEASKENSDGILFSQFS